MNRENLKKLVEEFLRTYGYIAKPTDDPNGILFSRPTGVGILDEILVYFHELGEESSIYSSLAFLNERYGRIPGGEGGRRFFLSPSPLGRVPESVSEKGFTYQVPVWFFDREFSSEKKTTPLKLLEKEADKYEEERIEQPYLSENGTTGEDLLSQLIEELENPQEPCLRIIIAPAGYGKTVLMGTLYTKLKEKFLQNKQRQHVGIRPLLLLPGHLKRADDLNGLITNFIGDEYDYGVANIEVFKFWVKNNFATCLIDGLEELILKIPDEFIYTLLDEYIYTHDSLNPQIVLAIRQPILATSPELRETIEEWQGTGLKVYTLRKWGKEQQKKYFYKNLKLNENEKRDFVAADLDKSDILQEICSIPYYCSLLADLKNNNQMGFFSDECSFVEHAIEKLCEREFEKGIDRDIVPVNIQKDLFIELERENLKSNKISKELLTELAEILLGNINEDIKKSQISCLLRHALLTQRGEDLDFTHDIIRHYIDGILLMGEIRNERLELFENRKIEKDSLAFKYLLKNCCDFNYSHWETIIGKALALPSSPNDNAIGFRNIMDIFLSTKVSEKEILLKYSIANKNLTGLVFTDLNLKGFNFQNSNLTDVEFKNCDLTNANLDRCHFKNTFFDPNCRLTGAINRGAIFETIKTETKVLDDQKTIINYLYKRTQVEMEIKGPCQATINLKKILEKIVRKGLGFQMPKKFLLQTKCGGGIPAYEILEACIKHGLLSEIGEQIKIKINLFDEVEQFVKELKVTNNIHRVLDDICKDKNIGCQHIYKDL